MCFVREYVTDNVLLHSVLYIGTFNIRPHGHVPLSFISPSKYIILNLLYVFWLKGSKLIVGELIDWVRYSNYN